MSGRARARGRARGQEISAPGTARDPTPPPGAALGGRGRQKVAPGHDPSEVLQISVGFHQVRLGERGGRRRDFRDEGINTRQTMEHVRESKTGTSGEPLPLTANYFRILSCPQWVLYQYHVDFNPPVESRRQRTALLLQHEQTLGEARCFDGFVLYLLNRLAEKETVLCSENWAGEKIQITVTLTNELPPSSPSCLHFYNIIFKRILRILNMQQIGRHYFNPQDALSIHEHKLTIWPGFCTSILEFESSIMLRTDVSHKVLRSETVLDFMISLKQRCGPDRFPDICSKELVGLIVLTKYNNKTYRIDDIAWDQNPGNTFVRGSTHISFKSYYSTQYGLEITDGKQVLLVSNVKRRVPPGAAPSGPALLIPEFCYLTGLTDKMRADNRMLKAMSEHTKLNPNQRERRLCSFVESFQRNSESRAELQKWGLRFDQDLVKLSGRLLPSETLFQGQRSYGYNPAAADWSREMRGIPVMSAPPLNNWLLLHTSRNTGETRALMEALHRVTGPMGFNLQKPYIVTYDDNHESLLRALQQNVKQQTQMVVVVLSNNRKEKYDSVKKYLCVDCPTPSQCVLSRTISKPQTVMTVATKIALQMACKLGGELWSVAVPLKDLMIVGIDCYHDTATGNTSIGALVASLNHNMSRWFSKCILQHRGQEIIDGLKMALTAALKCYLKINNCLPSRIVVYRDGVGDGQLCNVVDYEISQILDSVKSLGRDYNPRLTVIVVKKRIITRFFTRMGNKAENPPPGTVVDTEVTHREWYDFFIVSQTTRFGSLSPTHYNVVYDTSGLKPDHLQRLTYKLCHMYYNWQGVVSVPAPCQYAHKLAFLVGQSIHREPNMKLDDLLFYL